MAQALTESLGIYLDFWNNRKLCLLFRYHNRFSIHHRGEKFDISNNCFSVCNFTCH